MSDLPMMPDGNVLVNLPQVTLDALPMMITVFEVVSYSEFRIALVNRAGYDYTLDSVEVLGKQLNETLPQEAASTVEAQFQRCLNTDAVVQKEDRLSLDIGVRWTHTSYVPIRATDGHITHILAIWEDITDRKQRELAERAQQESIITHQAATLAELSTPLLSISDTTVVMPLIGTVDSRRVSHIMEALLVGVAERRATHVILDITGVQVVDTQVASAFVRASQAVSLLGAQVILTGIRPEVAQTLVGLGVDLQGIVTRGTLQSGIAYAREREQRG